MSLIIHSEDRYSTLNWGGQVRFIFSDRLLDTERRELRHGADLIAVEPQVFDLLVHLLANCDRVVSKDDLITSIWNGRVVSDSTVTSRINAARKAIGDSGDTQKLIRTIPRKGFRFIGDVCTPHSSGGRVAPSLDATHETRLALPPLPETLDASTGSPASIVASATRGSPVVRSATLVNDPSGTESGRKSTALRSLGAIRSPHFSAAAATTTFLVSTVAETV